jgi:hypothetical protein
MQIIKKANSIKTVLLSSLTYGALFQLHDEVMVRVDAARLVTLSDPNMAIAMCMSSGRLHTIGLNARVVPATEVFEIYN